MSEEKLKKYFSRSLWLSAAALLAFCSLDRIFLINISPSVPVGFYMAIPAHHPLRRGDLVRFCAPSWIAARGYVNPSAFCEKNTPALLKPVAGIPGDSIRVTGGQVFVNGHPTAARILRADSRKRQLPSVKDQSVPPNMFLPLSTYNPRSLDGRYFGPVSKNLILFRYVCLVCMRRSS